MTIYLIVSGAVMEYEIRPNAIYVSLIAFISRVALYSLYRHELYLGLPHSHLVYARFLVYALPTRSVCLPVTDTCKTPLPSL